MSNKCPNCGYEYSENDAFCAMCGVKLDGVKNDEEEENKLEDEQLNETKESLLDNMDLFSSEDDSEYNKEMKRLSFNPFRDSALLNFALSLIAISLVLWGVIFLTIQYHNDNKARLEYRNAMISVDRIPLLVEPTSYVGLKSNLYDVERFLSEYLKFSDDSQDKKEQIFGAFLNEVEKIPHITTDNFVNNLNYCSGIGVNTTAAKCASNLNNDFKDVGIQVYSDHNSIYMYPDYKFIYKKYKRYLSSQFNQYLKLKAKYNKPVSVGLELQVKPMTIANKIYDFEKLFVKVRDVYVREGILRTIYNDFRVFIFSPSIYSTVTQEMSPEFKKAYYKFISSNRKSQLRPIIMSYIEKQKNYSDDNFKNDYPYEIFDNSDSQFGIADYTLQDVFAALRKKSFNQKYSRTDEFRYVYSIVTSSWKKYKPDMILVQGEYALTSIDENNECVIYDSRMSAVQELNVPKSSKTFLVNGTLILYNPNKLQLSKVIYDGRNFSVQYLNSSDISSLFPGINVIYIDSYQDYTINITKTNERESYIILSRYMSGFDKYQLYLQQGKAAVSTLSNMFAVVSNEDAVLLFKDSSVGEQQTSEYAPTYKITVRTQGYTNTDSYNDSISTYDEKTKVENSENYTHNPNIKPKIIKEDNKENVRIDAINENIESVPMQQIEPPNLDDD